MSKRGAEARVGNEGSSGHDVTSSTSSEEQEEGDKYSGFLSTRGPIEEQMDVEMASETFPEQGLSEPLSLEDSFGKSEENTSQAIHVALAGAATRGDTYTKNVMLLKKEDLVQRDGKILMPTTIEMARTRKTGQYKKQVQFSKSMSEDAVREKIQETFPAFNLSVRFYCASISNTDSTLQFHGDPCVWDGKTIRKILKGNSALYIVMEEIENGLDMLMKVVLAGKEREEGDNDSGFLSTRGPIEERMDVEMYSGNEDSSGHDVTNSTSSENDLDMLMKVALAKKPLSLEDSSGKSEDILEIFPNRGPIEERVEGDNDSDILEIFSNRGPIVKVLAMLMEAALADEEQEEGDKDSGFLSTRGPIEEQMGVEMASETFPEQGLSELLSLEDSFGKSEENTSQAIHVAVADAATRGDTYSKNVMLLKKEDLAQGNGKILMPTTIEMARMRNTGQYKKHVQFSKSMSEDAVRKTIQETFPAFDLSGRFSCASISYTDSTLQFHGDPRVWDGKTIRRTLKGNSVLYIVMEEIENGLDMLMKVVLAVKERVEGDNDSGFLSTRVPIEERMDVEMASVTFPEQGLSEPLSSEDLSEKLEDILRIFPNKGPIEGGSPFVLVFGQSLEVESARVEFGGKAATDLQRVNAFNLIGRIPASDTPGNVTVTVCSSTGRILGKTDFCYNDLDILRIFPNKGPIEGGLSFVLVFRQSLEVESARVEFGGKAATDLQRVNDFNLSGRIPASDTPGNVTVTVRSSTGRILGKTDFCYNDRDILGIFPNKGPIEGGSPFVLVFGQSLEVKSARVEFGGKAATDLQRVNDFNLIGRNPASDTPGNVTVTVCSSTGRILGKTDFCYYDRGTSSELGPSEVTNFLL